MSAVEGRADVACQELSGPFIARNDHFQIFTEVEMSDFLIWGKRLTTRAVPDSFGYPSG
jgi:hypothetical protein